MCVCVYVSVRRRCIRVYKSVLNGMLGDKSTRLVHVHAFDMYRKHEPDTPIIFERVDKITCAEQGQWN